MHSVHTIVILNLMIERHTPTGNQGKRTPLALPACIDKVAKLIGEYRIE